jgi:signal peptidase
MKAQHHGPRRSVARVTGAALTVLLVTITLACAAFLAPSLFGYERYVITGGSMSGTIEKGSVVFEKKVPVAELRKGDVITYVPPADSGVATLVTHRIVEISAAESGARQFRTRGDANPKPDPWTFQLVDEKQAVAQASVPRVGWVLIALADREARMLALGVPAGLVALASLVELAKAVRPRPRPTKNREPVDLPSSFRGAPVDVSSVA